MTNFLPNVFRSCRPVKVLLFTIAAGCSLAAHAQADLHMSNLSLTAGDERQFSFSYTVSNSGNQAVAGYALKLTFSTNPVIDDFDYFDIVIAADPATQAIAASESQPVTVHFTASAVNRYLPTGTWYVIAEINPDHNVPESDYDNNHVVSDNMITVAPYIVEFLNLPTVTSVNDDSFVVGYVADGKIYQCYYRYEFKDTPAPTTSDMFLSPVMYAGLPVTVSPLSPAQAYDVYFMGEARDGNVTAVHKISVSTTGSSSPTVVTTATHISFFPTGIGQASLSGALDIYGYHLGGPLVITSSQGFAVSKDDVTYSDQLSLPVSEFNGGKPRRVFLRAKAFDSEGTKSGTCTLTTTGASNVVVSLAAVVFNSYATSYDGVSSLDETGWTTYNVSGSMVWNLVNLGESSVNQRAAAENMAMQIDGTSDGSTENEDWLISPAMDLSVFTLTPAVRFRAYSSGEGAPLTLMYSADYPGYGDPRSSTWFDAAAPFPMPNSKSWKNVYLPLTAQDEHIYFAIVYKSTPAAASRWTVDDWRITDNMVNIPDHDLLFDDVSVGTVSTAQLLLVSVSGFGNVTITASDEFQVSADGVVFGPAVVVPEADITAGISLRVRYAPKAFTEEKLGSLTFTGSNEFSVVRNTLIGHAGLTTAVAEQNTRGSFLYPNPTDGEVHIDLSSLPVGGDKYPVLVTNSMGMRVAYFDASAYAIDNALTNVFVRLDPGMYVVIIKAPSVTLRTRLIRK